MLHKAQSQLDLIQLVAKFVTVLVQVQLQVRPQAVIQL